MATVAGSLRPCYEAVCGGCEKDAIGLAFTRQRAERVLRDELGWKKTKARGWVCRECQQNPGRMRQPEVSEPPAARGGPVMG